MNVALLIDDLTCGGSEGVVQRLALGLAGRGHRPFIYCLKQAGKNASDLHAAGVTVREAHGRKRPWRLLSTLARWLRADRIDVAHCHSCAALVWTLPVAKLLSIPTIHVRHGWSLAGGSRYSRLADWFGPLVDAVGVNCESGRRRLPRRLARRVVYLPNGVDPPPTTRAEARQRLEKLCGRALNGPVILTLATIRVEKDYCGLLQAMARLRRWHPDATLVCCGSVEDPDYWAEVQRRWRELGLQPNVVFAGFCEQAARLLPGADVFCLSSRTEAMPNAVLEAMAQSVPIVATAVGDVGTLDPDAPADLALLRHNHTALLVPPGNPDTLAEALRLTLDDPAAAQARAKRAARRHAELFTTARMVARYEQLYQAVLAGNRVRPRRRRALSRIRRPRVLMLGPAPPQTGGMVTSIGLLMRSPLRREYELHRMGTPLPSAVDECGLKRGGGNGPVGRLTALRRHLGGLIRLAQRLSERRFDLAHIHTCSHFTFYRNLLDLLLAKLAGCRVVLQVRGGKFAEFCASRSHLGRWLVRGGLEWADAVILLSRNIRRAVRPYAGHARLLVVPNAFDPAALRAGQLRRRERQRSGPCRFLFLAALTQAKGLEDLLQAASLLRRRGPAFELHLAGPASPRLRRHWEQRLRELELSGVSQIVGAVSGRAKLELLAQADCLVHPSHCEGLPNAVLEAAAAGLPIIATAVGALPEAFSGAGAVPLVPPRDPQRLAAALERMAMDKAWREEVADRVCRHVLTNYNLPRVAAMISCVYRRAMRADLRTRTSVARPIVTRRRLARCGTDPESPRIAKVAKEPGEATPVPQAATAAP